MNITRRPVTPKGRRRKKRGSAEKEDEAFREWVQRQPSCLSGSFSEYINGEGRCVSAHVRRASTSGTAYKGKLSCVPMTQEEHDYQHQHGELAVLIRFGGWQDATGEAAKAWFDDLARHYVAKWRRTR